MSTSTLRFLQQENARLQIEAEEAGTSQQAEPSV